MTSKSTALSPEFSSENLLRRVHPGRTLGSTKPVNVCVCMFDSQDSKSVGPATPSRQPSAIGWFTKRSSRVHACHPSRQRSVDQSAAKDPNIGLAPGSVTPVFVYVYMSVSQDSKSLEPSNPRKAATSNRVDHYAPVTGPHVSSESLALSQSLCSATASRVHNYTPVPPASRPSPAGTGAGI